MVHLSYLISFLFLSDTDTFFSLSCSLSLSVRLLFSLRLAPSFSHCLTLYLSFSFCILPFFAIPFSLLCQRGLSMLHLLTSRITLSIFYLSFPFYPCHIHVLLHFTVSLSSRHLITLSPSPFPPHPPSSSSLCSLSLFSFFSSFVPRIISKMPGIFLTV